MTVHAPAVGALLGSHLSPSELPALARVAERSGFDELWVTEDLWYSSAMVMAGALLSATETIPVGIGIVSAVTRHASIQALDFGTLERLYPGRVRPGIGLGLPAWLDQMDLRPRSMLGAVRETVEIVRGLLAGEVVDREGVHVARGISLEHPPPVPPPIYVAATGERSLRQAGEIADGIVLSVLAGSTYVRWARDLVDAGAESAGRPRPRVVTFAFCAVDDDPAKARAAMRPVVGFSLTVGSNPMTEVQGIDDEVCALLAQGADHLCEAMPDAWIDELSVCGTPDDCAARIKQLCEAGTDSVILMPASADVARETLARVSADVLPRLRGRA